MEYHVYWLLKSSYFELSGDGKYGLLCAKTVMERWYLLITVLESSSFELFRDGKYGLFLSLKVDWKMILLINKSSCFEPWKVLVLKFWEMGNMAFLWTKKAMERWYLLGPFELSKIFQELRNIVFRTLLQVTSRDIGYLQTDGIAMDSPLGPVLNEISMIQSKMSLLILLVPELSFWKQYVNDTIIFIKTGTVDRILAMLN